jgi:hypothetical protein
VFRRAEFTATAYAPRVYRGLLKMSRAIFTAHRQRRRNAIGVRIVIPALALIGTIPA